MQIFLNGTPDAERADPMTVRCPACHHMGSFHAVKSIPDAAWTSDGDYRKHIAGVRVCPNRSCRMVIFVGWREGDGRITYPPETIDFDASNLPAKLLTTLEEAVKCHAAGCYRASALMVRRLLEELCENQNAVGRNLKERILALGSTAIVPSELLEAADELRILGNDAAHIEAREYDAIGEKEAALGIELAKEILKAVYQYSTLLSRLQALKNTSR